MLFPFFQNQNGSIVDALTSWKKNLDKRFEGVEECYICYFILHGSTYQLPKVPCPTCKKKFHSNCLYKWFSTSQNSSCPLCRTLFWNAEFRKKRPINNYFLNQNLHSFFTFICRIIRYISQNWYESIWIIFFSLSRYVNFQWFWFSYSNTV